MQLKEIVQAKYADPQKCYTHCEQQSVLKFLSGTDELTACYVCPAGYVSRIMVYGDEPNLDKFERFVSYFLGHAQEIKDEDFRIATRYSWDLGMEPEHDGKVIRIAYWTQNYRRTKSDDPNRIALFLCSGCNSLFSQPLRSSKTLCYECRAKT